MKTRRTTVLAAAVSAAIGFSTLTAAPASADAEQGCPYPYVCFYLTMNDYNNKHPTAMYKDVTPGYQTLGSQSRGAKAIVNTRNDDSASLKLVRNGRNVTDCISFNSTWANMTPQDPGTVTAIKILDTYEC